MTMFDSCLQKQQSIKDVFINCPTLEARYHKIIELGREQMPLDACYKTPANLVNGCQSVMYLHTFMVEGLIFFQAESEALISSGLASILTRVYSGETPETILKCPPAYIEELDIKATLTPNRANGLYSIHLKMKQEALKFLMISQKKNPSELKSTPSYS